MRFIQTYRRGYCLRAFLVCMASWMLLPPLSSQQLMREVGRHRVELEGETMRPGRAFRVVNQECPLAGPHFAKARKMRTWNAAFSLFGVTEVVVGVLAIEQDRLAFGIANAAVGGIIEGVLSNRNDQIQKEVEEGARAFNQCHFMRWKTN